MQQFFNTPKWPYLNICLNHVGMFNKLCDEEPPSTRPVMVSDLIIAEIPDSVFRDEMKQLKNALIKERLDALPYHATNIDKLQANVGACQEVVCEIHTHLINDAF